MHPKRKGESDKVRTSGEKVNEEKWGKCVEEGEEEGKHIEVK